MIAFILWVSLASPLLETHPWTYVLVAVAILAVRFLSLFLFNKSEDSQNV